jgi:hypothetical protein
MIESRCQLKVTVHTELRAKAKSLARRRRWSLSRLVEELITRALDEEDSGATPDESAMREMSILIAVELGIKLLEAHIPGGVTLSRRLLEDAALSAIERLEFVDGRLHKRGLL